MITSQRNISARDKYSPVFKTEAQQPKQLSVIIVMIWRRYLTLSLEGHTQAEEAF